MCEMPIRVPELYKRAMQPVLIRLHTDNRQQQQPDMHKSMQLPLYFMPLIRMYCMCEWIQFNIRHLCSGYFMQPQLLILPHWHIQLRHSRCHKLHKMR